MSMHQMRRIVSRFKRVLHIGVCWYR